MEIEKCGLCECELSGVEITRHLGSEKVYILCELCYKELMKKGGYM